MRELVEVAAWVCFNASRTPIREVRRDTGHERSGPYHLLVRGGQKAGPWS